MSLQGFLYLHDSSSEGLVLLVHGCSGVNNLLSESSLQLLYSFLRTGGVCHHRST